MIEYLVAMIVFVAAFFIALLVGWEVCRAIVWQPDDPLYRLLTWARDNGPLVVAAGLLAGWLQDVPPVERPARFRAGRFSIMRIPF